MLGRSRPFRTAALAAFALAAQAAPAAAADLREVAPKLKAKNIPDLPPALTERLVQFQNTRDAIFQDWIDGGPSLLVTTRFAETSQVHRIDFPLGARHQLTFGAEPVREALFATWRGRKGFFYLQDQGGSEDYQIWFHDLGDATRTLVTDGKSRNVDMKLSNGGLRLAFASTARNGKDFDIHVLDLAQEKPKRVLTVAGMWQPVDWSPDDTELLVRHFVSINESSFHRVDVATGNVVPLLPVIADTKVAVGHARYDRSGKPGPKGKAGVWFTSDVWGEFLQLGHVDLASGTVKVHTADVPWDVEALETTRDGKLLAFVTNEGGVSRLHLRQLPKLTKVAAPELPVGVAGSLRFDRKGEQLALSLQTPTGPSDVHVLDVRKKKLVRWTASEVGGLDTSRFVVPELVTYPTFDDEGGGKRMIPAFYYRPKGDGPFPVVVLLHGGPEAQFRPFFSPIIQYQASERGVAVLAPNFRGSAGYGKSFLLLDNGRKREDTVKDVGALLDWIGTRPELDAKKVGVYGGSYGGYMVLASMARHAGRIKAGIDVVGISNFVTFLENTKDYRRDLRRAEYGDERDPEMNAFLRSISPTTLAKDIKAPLFVAQGANDPRVPASESEQIVKQVESGGAPVWYLLAEDEGHGFQKKKNRDFFTAAQALFFDTYLAK